MAPPVLLSSEVRLAPESRLIPRVVPLIKPVFDSEPIVPPLLRIAVWPLMVPVRVPLTLLNSEVMRAPEPRLMPDVAPVILPVFVSVPMELPAPPDSATPVPVILPPLLFTLEMVPLFRTPMLPPLINPRLVKVPASDPVACTCGLEGPLRVPLLVRLRFPPAQVRQVEVGPVTVALLLRVMHAALTSADAIIASAEVRATLIKER